MNILQKVAEARKAIVNFISTVSPLIAYGFLPEPWNSYAAAAIAVVAIIVHYEVPNAKKVEEA